MLELATELRYLAADGKLNKPNTAVTLATMLENFARTEGGETGIAGNRRRQSLAGQ